MSDNKLVDKQIGDLVPGKPEPEKPKAQPGTPAARNEATKEWAKKFKDDDISDLGGPRGKPKDVPQAGRDHFPPIPPGMLRRPRALLKASDPGKAMSFPVVGLEKTAIIAIPQDELHQLIDDCAVMVMHLFDSAGLTMPEGMGNRLAKGLVNLLPECKAQPSAVAGLYYKTQKERSGS